YSVNKKTVTVGSGITASNKIYDGTTEATLDCSAADITGLISGDTLAVTATGAFEDANAGSNKAVSISSIAISGEKAVNYELASSGNQTTARANITAKSVTPVVTITGTCTYNGTEQIPEYTVKVGGVTLTKNADYTEACTNNTNAGTAKLTITKATGGNYDFSSVEKTFNIAKRSVKVSGITASDKTYDATDRATLDYTGARFDTLISGDTLTVTASGAFSNVNAGPDRTVNISGLTLGGASADNYTLALTGQQTTTTANISRKSITPNVTVTGTYTYNGSPINPTYTVWDDALNRSLAESDYTMTPSDQRTNAGTPSITIASKAGGNYEFASVTKNFTINQASVTVKADDKVKLKGNSDPALTASVTGLIGTDTVNYSLDRATGEGLGEYDITVSGLEDQGNYHVTFVKGKFSIVNKPTGTMNVTQSGTTYKGTSLAAPSYNKPAGTKISESITYSGTTRAGSSYASATAPTDAGSYTVSVTYETDSAIYTGHAGFTIAPANISSANIVLGSALTYNGSVLKQTISAITFGGEDILNDCTVSGDTTTSAGEHTLTVTAKAVSNYTGSLTKKYTVATQPVVVTGITASNKTYDGKKDAQLIYSGVNLAGVASGDTLTITATGTFADAKVGTGKTVNITNILLNGASASNYTLAISGNQNTTTANIEAKAITVSGIKVQSKQYDAATTATFDTSSAVLGGMISGDSLGVNVTGAFADKNVGNSKTVNISGYTLTGTSAGNYVLAASGNQSTATAAITAKAVTIKGVTAADKVYNGNNNATITGTPVLEGVIAGDSVDVDVTGASAKFEDKKAGDAKKVTFSGYKLLDTSADSANYSLTAQPAPVTAKISKAEVTISNISAKNKVYNGDAKAELDVSNVTISGKASGDDLSVAAVGTFSDKNVGTGKRVDLSGITLVGSDKDNYVIASAGSQTYASADISKANHDDITMERIEIRSGGVTDGIFDIRGYLTEDATVGATPTKSGDAAGLITLKGLNSDKQYVYDASSSQVDKTGEVRFIATSTNYNDYTIIVPISVKAKVAEAVLEKGSTAAQTNTGVLHISAAGLSTLADELEGTTGVLRMVVTPKAATDTSVSAEEKTAIEQKADAAMPGIANSNISQDFLEIDVNKSVDGGTEQAVTNTSRVVEIPMRYNMTRRYSPVVMRVHDGNTSALRKLSSKPAAGDYADGTYFISGTGANTDIFIYSSGFSLYSIAYTTSPTAEVTYNNGIGGTNSMDAVIGQKLIKPATPGREGYTFTGWYDSTGALWNFDTGVMASSGMTLTAGWSQNSKESQSSGGGSSSSSSDSSDSSSSAPAAVVKKAGTDANAALTALLANATGKNKKKSDVTKSAGKNGTDAVSDADALDSKEFTEAGGLRAPNTGDTLPNEWILLIIMLMGLALIGYGIREYGAVYRREDR
nr:InlB B-repeat-containing protein [Lachnospiraceae bacterium]